MNEGLQQIKDAAKENKRAKFLKFKEAVMREIPEDLLEYIDWEAQEMDFDSQGSKLFQVYFHIPDHHLIATVMSNRGGEYCWHGYQTKKPHDANGVEGSYFLVVQREDGQPGKCVYAYDLGAALVLSEKHDTGKRIQTSQEVN
jgi:hypothetical protein